MPKSPKSSPSTANSKPSGDDANVRMSDIALRKKKNADAQAAFRARRANYIATLEETVTSLESVVLQLQDSWRESRAELDDARQEITRLQQHYRERERFWRDLWENRRTGPLPDVDDIASSSPSFSPLHGHSSGLGSQIGHHLASYTLDGMGYRSVDDNPSQSTYAGQQEYSATGTSALSFNETDVSGDGSHCLNQRVEKVSYVQRYAAGDSKLALNNFETAPFSFPESRSLSPSSTPSSTSTSSASMSAAPYSYPFSDHIMPQDSFRRSHNAEMTLHGGTADISVVPATDGVRYRYAGRQPVSQRTMHRNGNESQYERANSDVVPGLSCTVAVIKAQAFGALRRTRTRTKKTTETASRVAMDVLEARGIGLSPTVGHRHNRSLEDDEFEHDD